MGQNKVIVIAILAGALIIAAAVYLRPNDFDSCVANMMSDGNRDRHGAALYCSRN